MAEFWVFATLFSLLLQKDTLSSLQFMSFFTPLFASNWMSLFSSSPLTITGYWISMSRLSSHTYLKGDLIFKSQPLLKQKLRISPGAKPEPQTENSLSIWWQLVPGVTLCWKAMRTEPSFSILQSGAVSEEHIQATSILKLTTLQCII